MVPKRFYQWNGFEDCAESLKKKEYEAREKLIEARVPRALFLAIETIEGAFQNRGDTLSTWLCTVPPSPVYNFETRPREDRPLGGDLRSITAQAVCRNLALLRPGAKPA